jgi:hypothetical protein
VIDKRAPYHTDDIRLKSVVVAMISELFKDAVNIRDCMQSPPNGRIGG